MIPRLFQSGQSDYRGEGVSSLPLLAAFGGDRENVFEFIDDAEYWYNVLLIYHHLNVLYEADLVREPPLNQIRNQNPQQDSDWWSKRPDTDKTIYRHNHLKDAEWNSMNETTRRLWVANMVRIHGKSVVT